MIDSSKVLKQSNLTIFLIVTLIVLYIHRPLFQLLPQMNLSTDDWILRTHFKLLGSHPYQEFFSYFKYKSAYFAYQTFYIGTLEEVFGFNPPVFNIVNLTLKILATLSVYPLVLIMFKRKLLAFLATIIFAFNYNSVGTLEYIMKGADYIGILFMNLFLMIYSYSVINKLATFRWVCLLSIFFVLSLLTSPARLYPLLVIPILVEFFLLLNHRSIVHLWVSLKRILFLYSPLAIVFLSEPKQFMYLITRAPSFIMQLVQAGHWDQILVPFAGVGLTLFPPNIGFSFFSPNLVGLGLQNIGNVFDLIVLLFSKFLIIFGLITFLILKALSGKPVFTTFVILSINLLLDIAVFFVFEASLKIPVDLISLYSILIGIYTLVLGLVFIFMWQTGKSKSQIALPLGLGPIFSFIFVLLTWILADQHLSFGGMHYYLVVASMGSSLFIASYIVAIYNGLRRIKTLYIPLVATATMFLVVFLLYYINSKEVYAHFDIKIKDGRGAYANNRLNQQMQYYLDKYQIDIKNPTLFYFDETGESNSNRNFYEQGFTSNFLYWMHLKDKEMKKGCIGIMVGNSALEDMKKLLVKADQEYVEHYGSCIDPGRIPIMGYNRQVIRYNLKDIYFFRLKDRQIIDITEQTIKQLYNTKL